MSFYDGYGATSSSGSRKGQGQRSGSDMDIDDDTYRTDTGPVTRSRHAERYDDPNAPHMRSQTYAGDHGRYGGSHQMLTQEQAYRSAQASKQMVYEVFGNVISILEEFEARETSKHGTKSVKSVPRSDIFTPDQSRKRDDDVQRILEAQLLLFQTQLHSACRPEVRAQVLEEMKEKTKRWMAVRQEKGIQHGKTDEYAVQLYEILSRGGTQHPSVFAQKPFIDERELQTAARQVFAGDHRRAELDASFHRDPNKKATMPPIRSGASVESGIDRFDQVRPGLVVHGSSIR